MGASTHCTHTNVGPGQALKEDLYKDPGLDQGYAIARSIFSLFFQIHLVYFISNELIERLVGKCQIFIVVA